MGNCLQSESVSAGDRRRGKDGTKRSTTTNKKKQQGTTSAAAAGSSTHSRKQSDSTAVAADHSMSVNPLLGSTVTSNSSNSGAAAAMAAVTATAPGGTATTAAATTNKKRAATPGTPRSSSGIQEKRETMSVGQSTTTTTTKQQHVNRKRSANSSQSHQRPQPPLPPPPRGGEQRSSTSVDVSTATSHSNASTAAPHPADNSVDSRKSSSQSSSGHVGPQRRTASASPAPAPVPSATLTAVSVGVISPLTPSKLGGKSLAASSAVANNNKSPRVTTTKNNHQSSFDGRRPSEDTSHASTSRQRSLEKTSPLPVPQSRNAKTSPLLLPSPLTGGAVPTTTTVSPNLKPVSPMPTNLSAPPRSPLRRQASPAPSPLTAAKMPPSSPLPTFTQPPPSSMLTFPSIPHDDNTKNNQQQQSSLKTIHQSNGHNNSVSAHAPLLAVTAPSSVALRQHHPSTQNETGNNDGGGRGPSSPLRQLQIQTGTNINNGRQSPIRVSNTANNAETILSSPASSPRNNKSPIGTSPRGPGFADHRLAPRPPAWSASTGSASLSTMSSSGQQQHRLPLPILNNQHTSSDSTTDNAELALGLAGSNSQQGGALMVNNKFGDVPSWRMNNNNHSSTDVHPLGADVHNLGGSIGRSDSSSLLHTTSETFVAQRRRGRGFSEDMRTNSLASKTSSSNLSVLTASGASTGFGYHMRRGMGHSQQQQQQTSPQHGGYAGPPPHSAFGQSPGGGGGSAWNRPSTSESTSGGTNSGGTNSGGTNSGGTIPSGGVLSADAMLSIQQNHNGGGGMAHNPNVADLGHMMPAFGRVGSMASSMSADEFSSRRSSERLRSVTYSMDGFFDHNTMQHQHHHSQQGGQHVTASQSPSNYVRYNGGGGGGGGAGSAMSFRRQQLSHGNRSVSFSGVQDTGSSIGGSTNDEDGRRETMMSLMSNQSIRAPSDASAEWTPLMHRTGGLPMPSTALNLAQFQSGDDSGSGVAPPIVRTQTQGPRLVTSH